MPYPEIMIRPMREDLTRLGVEEWKTADAVDNAVKNSKGTLMVVVNSICGCAAGKARPGVALALLVSASAAEAARTPPLGWSVRPEPFRLTYEVGGRPLTAQQVGEAGPGGRPTPSGSSVPIRSSSSSLRME